MGSLLWFVIFGAIFYFLMAKGGCGSHGHGGHGSHGGHGDDHNSHAGNDHSGNWITRDPVCGMQGPISKARESTEYHGRVYHFCSTKCLELFKQNPERYIDGGGHHHGSH